MTIPQAENGHIDVNHDNAKAFAKYHLSGNEWQILWVVLEKTWGWHKKNDCISLTQFQQLTELSRQSVKEAIDKLVLKKVLVVDKNGYINNYSFNKLYSEWIVPKRGLVPKNFKMVPKKGHTKETNTKESIINNTNVLVKTETAYGNPDINEAVSYLKSRLNLPMLDETVQKNRQYANLLMRKHGGLEFVKRLIDAAAESDFWANKVTSMSTLYYKAMIIINSSRTIKNSYEKI